jgi:hypothetical protein
MQEDVLEHPRAIAVILELGWGDRFEADLSSKTSGIKGDWELSFEDIRDELVRRGLVYQLKGGRGSPYLALTDEGQRLAGDLRIKQDSQTG